LNIYTHTHTYIYTHKQNKISTTKIKYNRFTRQTKETKHYIYQLRQKLTKAQNGNQNESKVPSGELRSENQAKKMLRGKERKKE